MTPLEELLAANRRRIEEGKIKPGQEGMFYRLCEMADANFVSNWLNGEFKVSPDGKINPRQAIKAYANHLAFQLVCISAVAGSKAGFDKRIQVIEAVIEETTIVLDMITSGDAKVHGVTSHPDGNTQREATGEGFMKEKDPNG